MPCNAIATIRAKINQPASLDEAIKELTLTQAKALFTALLIEGTKFEARNVITTDYGYETRLTCGSLQITIKINPATQAPTNATLIDQYDDYTPAEFAAKQARFNAQTIKASGLIKQAKALQSITQAYKGATTTNAPNGAKIITLDL